MVFTNFKKGTVAKSSELTSAFGSLSPTEILQKIVKEGDLQTNAGERKEEAESFMKKVIDYLNRSFVDAKGLPHPIAKIESLIEESKIKLNQSESVSKQAEKIIKKLQGKAVFKKSSNSYSLFLKKEYTKEGKILIHRFCDVKSEEWSSEGCTWTVLITLTNFDLLIESLNKFTGGDYTISTEEEKKCKHEVPTVERQMKTPVPNFGKRKGEKGKKKEKRKRNREEINDTD